MIALPMSAAKQRLGRKFTVPGAIPDDLGTRWHRIDTADMGAPQIQTTVWSIKYIATAGFPHRRLPRVFLRGQRGSVVDGIHP
jgi:hypothetical protein